eukprot:TRINITY_DN20537_c2_g1_i1.p1 TRINITY_DN20537_c2_g1~~TRINITY_DN20537_c2_g1_i1.p1  ORF type:complete len:599 (+),score=110.92 TRINITY_DN20537_c2_g1_i1:73-1869(+)
MAQKQSIAKKKGALDGGPSMASTTMSGFTRKTGGFGSSARSFNSTMGSEGSISQLGSYPKCPGTKLSTTAYRFEWEKPSFGREPPPHPSQLKASQSSPSLLESSPGEEETDLDHTQLHEINEADWQDICSETPQQKRMAATYSVGDFVPRLDGATRRFAPVPQHAGIPIGKFYGPSRTMGKDTAPRFRKGSLWSFGGGKSRQPPPEEAITAAAEKRSPSKSKPQICTGLSDAATGRKSRRKKTTTGFGTDERCKVKGGPMELAVSPGPAAYNQSRFLDALPDWAPDSLVPWGKRSAQRPDMKLVTATDAGPGEYTADHPFQAAGPAPKFGHPLKDAASTTKDYPDPQRYDIPSTVGDGPAFSVGSGPRSNAFKGNGTPAPGIYGPDGSPPLDGVIPNKRGAVFSYAERAHPCDGVDPDEPPGPGNYVPKEYKGSHKVYMKSGWPKDPKLKKVSGMGPLGIPGPGEYKPENERLGWGVEFRGRLKAKPPPDYPPPPGTYDPKYHMATSEPLSCGAMLRTAPRKSPFDLGGGSSDASSAALLQKALKAAAEANGGQAEKKDQPTFIKNGPFYSLGARREAATAVPRCGSDTMLGSYSSMG